MLLAGFCLLFWFSFVVPWWFISSYLDFMAQTLKLQVQQKQSAFDKAMATNKQLQEMASKLWHEVRSSQAKLIEQERSHAEEKRALADKMAMQQYLQVCYVK